MQIFISYSRRDEDFVRRLAQALAKSGLDVWMDLEDIEVGSKWSTAIQRGLDNSNVMLVVLSPASMASTNVEDEFTYYLDHHKPIIPILLEPTKVHFQLGRLQYIDFHTQPFETAFAALQAEIEKRRPQGDVVPSPDAPGVIKTGKFPAVRPEDLGQIQKMADQERAADAASSGRTPAGTTGEGTVPATTEASARRSRRTADPTADVEDVYDADYLPTTPPPVEFAFTTNQSQVTVAPAVAHGAEEAYHVPLGHSDFKGEIPPMSAPLNRNALIFSGIAIVAALFAVFVAIMTARNNSTNPPATNDGILHPSVQAAAYREGDNGGLAIKQPDGWNYETLGERDFHIYNRSWFGGRFSPEPRVPEGEIDIRVISHQKDGSQFSSEDLREIAYGSINGTLTALNQRYAITNDDINAVSVNGNPAYYARGQLDSAEYLMMLIDYQDSDWIEVVIVNTGPETLNDNQAIISDLIESITVNG
jgi:hypothetical protein